MIPTQHGIPMYYYPPPPSSMPPRSPQPPGGMNTSHRRGRSTRRDFVYGTPPDYVPRLPPEELIRRGRQRARSLSEVATAGISSGDRERSYSRRPKATDFAYAEQRTSNPHRHSRSVSHHRSGHHHRSHPHRHRNSVPPRDVTPTRPHYTRGRSHSPFQQVAHNHGYHQPSTFHPSTGRNMPAYGPITVPLVESRGRPQKSGFFSRLFGMKAKDTHVGRGYGSRSLSVQPTQPYIAYGSSAPYGSQGNAFTQMYSPLPAPPIAIPSTHRHRRRGRSH
jgi:hypothetical protein